MEGQNGSTEALDIKTAIQIAKILAAAPDERIPMILDVFQKAEVNIGGLDELAECSGYFTQECFPAFVRLYVDV